jgi:perosamine synthetase
MSSLALFGGNPVIQYPLPLYPSLGDKELQAVTDVVKSGSLSGFYGSWGEEFLGGVKVKEFERHWSERFKVKHSISVNSNTAGLIAAMGAIGISPGDEVIVPPTTMSATVMSPLFYGGIPVFADIEDETFCIDPADIRRKITSKTRAIIAVNIFGHPARLHELRTLADEYGIYLIEDNAQSPLGMENDAYTGTIGHIGVFSLNYHKHIHTGEGGMCTTNDDMLALRLQMIRNHAENIVNPVGMSDITNMIGSNMRMTEMSAAVGIAQLEDADSHIGKRTALAENLSRIVQKLPGLTPPMVREGCRHIYYVWTIKFDEAIVGVSRDVFSKALNAEGFPNFTGYIRPLYMLPVFQQRKAIGRDGFPFTLAPHIQYEWGMCPTAERLYEKEFLCFETCAYDISEAILADFEKALKKVYEHRHELIDATMT